ncbi:glycoside hydrolase [Ramicandelaber brevisporus]|nr:glycoside hydrolase [Ramicandelaber brevisporus]
MRASIFYTAIAATTAAVVTAAVPFRDQFGRIVNLRGFNTAASSKHSVDGMPWIRPENVEREAREIGSNFVRYLLQWSNIEPQPGVYNETYLDMTMDRVGWYRDNGFHVMLDFHQDIWSKEFTGNGAPAWATFTDGLVWKFVNPWFLTNAQPGVSRAWDNFWGTASSRGDELQGRFASMAAHVAAKFKGKVYAIEIMNEPYGGALISPIFEPLKLKPFYQRVIDEIRKVDTDVMVFYEPQSLGINQGLASCLPGLDRERVAYAPHIYPLGFDTGPYTGFNKLVIKGTIDQWKFWRAKETSNVPMIVGEFGADGLQPGGLDYLDDILDMADSLGAGWAYWSYDVESPPFKKRDSEVTPVLVKRMSDNPNTWSPLNMDLSHNELGLHLARPYARAIAGNDASWSYDRNARKMIVKFTLDGNIKAPTEIYVPVAKFPNGYAVDGADAFKQTFDEKKRIISLTGGVSGTTYQISVSPK